jgi:4'-phosphopantetheinyl transferase
LRVLLQNPAAFLSAVERETLGALHYRKRRREWLLGRWTAKQLLVRARPQYAGLPLADISVCNDPDGAPYLSLVDRGRLPLSLSISHRDDRAFCALAPLAPAIPEFAIGADIERVEARAPAFVRDFFTLEEAERVWQCPEAMRDTFVTVLWSAKEAVLKVLRLGLTVDTRRVEIVRVGGIEPSARTRVPPTLPRSWAEVEIRSTLSDAASFIGWWRSAGAYVLTLAASVHPTFPPARPSCSTKPVEPPLA